jgi:hypothetical protein
MDPDLRRRALDMCDMIAKRLDEAEERRDAEDLEEELAEGHTMPVAPNAPFADSPPDMPKEPLWSGKPPIPIEHI